MYIYRPIIMKYLKIYNVLCIYVIVLWICIYIIISMQKLYNKHPVSQQADLTVANFMPFVIQIN